MSRVPQVVVVGNGMAGYRFVAELLGFGTSCSVTVIGEEPGGAYNRVQLSHVLAGTAGADSVELAGTGWYAGHGVRLLSGVAARRVDRSGRLVELADGSAIRYDVLVLATGAGAVIPAAGGLTDEPPAAGGPRLPDGAVAFRTFADCAEIQARAAVAGHAVVLGGGVLGLETACGLAACGLPVTLVQRGGRLMERQLDAPAGRVLGRAVRSSGVTALTGASVRHVRGTTSTGGTGRAGGGRGVGKVTGVELGDGRVLGADLLVLCCGTRPRTALARAAGLATAAGIVVDDQMRSVTDPAVFAVGDCAEHRGRVYGLVAPAWAQARVAAQALARSATRAGLAAGDGDDDGDGPLADGLGYGGPPVGGSRGGHDGYAGSADVVRLKAPGIELAVLGSARAGGRAEVIRFADPARGVYQKLVVRDGRLAGAILLGDTRAAGTLTQLLDRGGALPADRASLLIGRRGAAPAVDSPVAIPGHATICQCNGVTKAAICAAWEDGARTTGDIAARTQASTGCGTCRDAVSGIAAWLAAAEPGLVPA